MHSSGTHKFLQLKPNRNAEERNPNKSKVPVCKKGENVQFCKNWEVQYTKNLKNRTSKMRQSFTVIERIFQRKKYKILK